MSETKKYIIIGLFIIFFIFFLPLYKKIFFGGDIGFSVIFPEEFYDINIKYSWNHYDGLGRFEPSLSWLLFYQIIKIFSFNKILISLIYILLPLCISYIIVYISINRVNFFEKKVLILFSSFIFIFSPINIKSIIYFPPSYSLLVISSLFFFIFLNSYFGEITKKDLIFITILVSPFFFLFSNLYYIAPVILSFVFLNIFSKKRYMFFLSILLIFSIYGFFFIPFFSSIKSSEINGRFDINKDYLISYVKTESKSVNFYNNFLVNSKNKYINIFLIFYSIILFLISIGFSLIRIKEDKKNILFFIIGLILFILGVTLSNGIKPPTEGINKKIYSLFYPYSFGFRSPFYKFSIISHLGFFIILLYSLKFFDRKPIKLNYFFVSLIIISSIFISFEINELYKNGYIISNYENVEKLSNLYSKLRFDDNYESKIIIFPLNSGVFSIYKENTTIYKGAANEYIFLKRPTIQNYKWGKNNEINTVILTTLSKDEKDFLDYLKLLNIKYLLHVKNKEGVFNDCFESLNLSYFYCNYDDNITFCRSNINTTQFNKIKCNYQIKNYEFNFYNNTINKVTNNEVFYQNESIVVKIDQNIGIEGAVDIKINNFDKINPFKDNIKLEIFFDDPYAIEVSYLSINTNKGYITYMLPRDVKKEIGVTLNKNNIVKIYNFSMNETQKYFRISFWMKENSTIPKTYVIIRKIEVNKYDQDCMIDNIYSYKMVNPTFWKVQINSTEPFMLSFAESYDPLWEARVYKNGKLVEKSKPVPLYGVINGFWINTTGENLEIVIRYKPQDYFEIGLIISGTTLAACIAYLIYDWKRDFFNEKIAKVLRKKYRYKPKK